MLKPRPPLPSATQVRRVAVLRANALGDFVATLPALEALRAAWPAARITLLGLPWHADFLAGRPGPVDEVAVVPAVRGIREGPGLVEDADELVRFVRAVRGPGLDVAVQMHGGGRWSNPFVRSLGADLTAGFRAPDACRLDVDVPYRIAQHEVLRHLELAAVLGAPPVTLLPRLQLRARDRAEAARVLPDVRPLAVVHPGAGDARRRWPAERFAHVADRVAATGATVVLTGTAKERETVEAVRDSMRRPERALFAAVSVGGLAAVLAEAAVVVANDTGPLHLARAVGVPTVGVYWGFNLPTWGPLLRGADRAHAGWRSECPVCGVPVTRPELPGPDVPRCEHTVSYVDGVDVEPVVADTLDLLAG